MENLNKECCVVTGNEDCCDSAATVNVYVNAKRHVNCGCGDSGTGSNPDATNDHDQLINKNLGIQHEAAAVAFADGESIQQKYDNGELIGTQGEQGEKGEPGEKGETGAQGERGYSGVFVPDWSNPVEITSLLNAAGKTYTFPQSGFLYVRMINSGADFQFAIEGTALRPIGGIIPGAVEALSAQDTMLIGFNAGDTIKTISFFSNRVGLVTIFFIPPVAALLPSRASDLAIQPQNWTAGSEIDFQDGSFGQRFTGTITASADEFVNTELMEAVATIISCGGMVAVDTNTPAVKGSVPYSGAVTADESVSLEANINNGQAYVSLFSKCSAVRADAEYDVWIRYTK